MCVWFPQWPLQCLQSKPLGLETPQNHDDSATDRSLLRKIALDYYAYSSLVGLEESTAVESIWLDISSNEELWGGEHPLSETILAEMARRGLQVRVAIADSWGAAWAVSHYGGDKITLIPAGQQAKWLAPLPIAALRVSETIRQALCALGILKIDQLMRLPRESLSSRFGKELIQRLDQALGFAPEILTAERSVEPLFVEWLFEEPVSDRQSIDHVCSVLLERLLKFLDERHAGLRELSCRWLGTAAEPTLLRLLRPTTDRRHLLALLRLQCEQRVFFSGIHGVRMEVVEMGFLSVRQTSLFGDEIDAKNPQALAELVDRLSLRLGHEAVLRLRMIPDSQPEFACESSAWLKDPRVQKREPIANLSRLRCRPLCLFRSPKPIFVRGALETTGLPSSVNQSAVTHISGPERIETGWWRGLDIKRDYYRIRLANGSTLWAFVDCDTGFWFQQGLFL